ncbi:MAG: PsiF family protein [Nitrospiraceae bacterium]
MSRLLSLVMATAFASFMMATPPVWAAAQQNKMKTCNADADAKGLGEGKGDERKAFMKECLSAKPAKAAAKSTQQSKMKTCNKEAGAKNLKGDDRKKFMSECLSN